MEAEKTVNVYLIKVVGNLMKILQINNVYDFGSTGKITRDLHHGLLEYGYDSVVYYGRRYKTKDPNVYKICSEFYGKAQNGIYQISGIKYGGCHISTKRLISFIRKENPDIVHLQCLNGHFVNIYQLVTFLKEQRIPTVLTLHAEFMYTGGCSHAYDCNQWRLNTGCGHAYCPAYKKELKSKMGDRSAEMWKRMNEAFSGFDNLIVVSVSPWLMKRAESSKILNGKKHIVILNGVETDIFQTYSDEDSRKIREELGYTEKDMVVFHASPSFDNDPNNLKGGYYVLELAKKMNSVKFVVAGRYDPTIKISENVKLLGNVTDKTYMAKLYAMANATLITSKRETFSMVCAESLCCGTPVIGFKAGAPEMISIPEYSKFCDYGDLDSLERFLYEFPEHASEVISHHAHIIYGVKKMCDEYINLYKEISEKIWG